MKKIISIVCIFILTLAMGTTALAAETDTKTPEEGSTIEYRIAGIQKRFIGKKENREQKRAAIEAFRATKEDRRSAFREKSESNIIVRKNNVVLRRSIVSSLKGRKDNGITLDAKTTEQLKIYQKDLYTLTEELKAIRSNIHEIISTHRGDLKALDQEAMEAIFEQIKDMREERNEKLNQVNELLELMDDLLMI